MTYKKIILSFIFLLFSVIGWAKGFVPNEPYASLASVKKGERGYVKTTVEGNKIVTFEVEALDLMYSPTRPRRLLLIRGVGKEIQRLGGFAEGMSGSPVYFNGKLVGAVGYTWPNSDHYLAQVTDIEEMCQIFEYPAPQSLAIVPKKGGLSTPWNVSGISQRGLAQLASKGISFRQGAGAGSTDPKIVHRKLKPGDAIAVRLAWGDVDMNSIGTVTAVDDQGHFLAFGHSLNQNGAVMLPVSEALVHALVPNSEVPFKLASPGDILGTLTQDRAEGIGGVFGKVGPSTSVKIKLTDRQTHQVIERGFRLPADSSLYRETLTALVVGLIDDMQNRVGAGTMTYDLTINGAEFPEGLRIHDVALDETDVTSALFDQVDQQIQTMLNNPFKSLDPLGIKLDIVSTPKLRRISLAGLDAQIDGDQVKVQLSLKPLYPKEGVVEKKTFTLQLPPQWSSGIKVTARAGAPAFDMESSGAPTDFRQFVDQLTNDERCCEIVVEVTSDDQEIDQSLSVVDQSKQKRLEGTMRVFRVDGLPQGSLVKNLSEADDESEDVVQ